VNAWDAHPGVALNAEVGSLVSEWCRRNLPDCDPAR
jgi:hypothetical protein